MALAPFLRLDAGVSGSAVHCQGVCSAPFPAADDVAVGARGFQNQRHVGAPGGLGVQRAGSGRSDFFVAVQKEADLGEVIEADSVQGIECVETGQEAGLHVRHARTDGPVSLEAQRPLGHSAHRVDGVQVPDEQHARLARPVEGRQPAVAEVCQGEADDVAADSLQPGLHHLPDRINAWLVVGSAVHVDQRFQAGEIVWQVLLKECKDWIHEIRSPSRLLRE